MEQKLFRQIALERLSSSEQLDQLLPVTTPLSWLALLALGILLLAAAVWSFTAAISTEVAGQGMLIRSSEDAGSPLEALLSLSPTDAANVRPGMAAQVSPASAPREVYGALRGTVASVAEASARTLAKEQQGAPVEVRVALVPDASTASRYQWSLPGGPSFELRGGTPCQVRITLSTQRPIDLLLPALGR